MMKKLLFPLLCAACFIVSPARAQQVTLAELRQQTPDRLRMEVVTRGGDTVTVDATILLPEGDVMPLVLVKRATFNTLNLFDLYPLPKGRDPLFYAGSRLYAQEGCNQLCIYQEEAENNIYGKTDHTHRYVLPKGALPPYSDMTIEEIMAFVYENIKRFHCGAPPDIRLEEAVAMSGLCEMKRVKVTDGNGVSWTEFTADPDKPTKKGTKGIWSLKLSQYMYGARILDTYSPYGDYSPPSRPEGTEYWYSPVNFHVDVLDDKNRIIEIWAVKEVGILNADVALLPYRDMVRCLEERIREGLLKSVYTLQLAYSVRIVKGDSFMTAGQGDFNPDTRFVLVPEWQILGFDEKDAAAAKSAGYQQPSKEAILDPDNHSRYGTRYEVRMDAATGKFILDYASQVFDLLE